jgi:hypothetical protein
LSLLLILGRVHILRNPVVRAEAEAEAVGS